MEGHVTAMKEVVGEILLDYVALVTAANDEFVNAMVAVGLEDVPQDWHTTDFHHWLGPQVGFLGEAGAKAPSQDYGFH